MRRFIDPFTLLLLAAIVAAAFWPARGDVADGLAVAAKLAVALLFFIHGAALSRESVTRGALHWRLHLLIFALTFIAFPLLVLPIAGLAPALIPPALALGFLYLGALPSAVSSSIAFTAMAGGNVPAAICSAAASNVFGMMMTPFLLVALTQTSAASGFEIGDALADIVAQLLAPFAAGQAIRPWLARVIDRHSHLSARYDQGVILLIVYTAFSQSVASGLWADLAPATIALALLLCVLLLAVMLAVAVVSARRLGFDLADETAAVFCGSKKSLASGLPMANVLFAGHAGLGLIVLPIMIYNQIQIIVGAVLARRYARRLRT